MNPGNPRLRPGAVVTPPPALAASSTAVGLITLALAVALPCLAQLPFPASPGEIATDAPAPPAAAHPLVWDAMEKTCDAKAGAAVVEITFEVTNRGARDMVIESVEPSCGCTVAEMPAHPWRLAPRAKGVLRVAVNLVGKSGEVTKSVLVQSAAGGQTLTIKLQVPPMDAAARERNQRLAQANRQAVFGGDCARCHATPAVGKQGGELFAAACAICHAAPQRAALVPDIGAARAHRDAAYWHGLIAEGRPQTLMPAFARSRGGPLTDGQIVSLVDFLIENFPGGSDPEAGATDRREAK